MTTNTFGEQQFCGQCGSMLSPEGSCPNIQCSMYRRPSTPSYSSEAPTLLSSGPQPNPVTPNSPPWGDPGQVTSPSHSQAQPPRSNGPTSGSFSSQPQVGSIPSQPPGSKIHPRQNSNTRIYQLLIIALVVLLIGAAVLFLAKPGQTNQPVVTGKTSTATNQTGAILGGGTTPTLTPTHVPTATPTHVPTATPSPTPTQTAPSPTPTATPLPQLPTSVMLSVSAPGISPTTQGDITIPSGTKVTLTVQPNHSLLPFQNYTMGIYATDPYGFSELQYCEYPNTATCSWVVVYSSSENTDYTKGKHTFIAFLGDSGGRILANSSSVTITWS